MVNHRYAIFGHITIMPLAYIIELYLITHLCRY